jgi:hypothetical protein
MTVPDVVLAGVDLALLILGAEAIILGLYRWRTGRGLSFGSIALISMAGFGLLVALKAALLNANLVWLALGLVMGGVAHGLDLVRRIQQETITNGKDTNASGV